MLLHRKFIIEQHTEVAHNSGWWNQVAASGRRGWRVCLKPNQISCFLTVELQPPWQAPAADVMYTVHEDRPRCGNVLWRHVDVGLFVVSIYTVFHKNDPYLIAHIFSKCWPIFNFFFTFGLNSDCVMNWSLKIPSLLKCVDTLPCKTLVFKNWSN